MRDAAKERGEDVDELPRQYVKLINEALRLKPADMTASVHLCRGNFRSRHFASGGYEPVAEILFRDLEVDNFLLEWDDERSGGLEPLRFLPKDGKKRVVLGLVSTKTGKLEDKAKIVERIREAAKFAPLEQLGMGPQCGCVPPFSTILQTLTFPQLRIDPPRQRIDRRGTVEEDSILQRDRRGSLGQAGLSVRIHAKPFNRRDTIRSAGGRKRSLGMRRRV